MTADENHTPDQPDGISPYGTTLPDPQNAAERVQTFLSEFGDGMITVRELDMLEGVPPLYARDLQALANLTGTVNQLRGELADEGHSHGLTQQAYESEQRSHAAARAEIARLRDQLDTANRQVDRGGVIAARKEQDTFTAPDGRVFHVDQRVHDTRDDDTGTVQKFKGDLIRIVWEDEGGWGTTHEHPGALARIFPGDTEPDVAVGTRLRNAHDEVWEHRPTAGGVWTRFNEHREVLSNEHWAAFDHREFGPWVEVLDD